MISFPETMKQSLTEMTNAVNRETCPLEELADEDEQVAASPEFLCAQRRDGEEKGKSVSKLGLT